MSPQFEWDATKAAGNLKKHGVGFDEALTQRLLVVGFTERNERVRIITARSQPGANAKPMKRSRTSPKASDELRAEYDFSYAQARPNRFAPRMRGPVVAVVLEPDVAEVFSSSDSVNRILRSVISALPRAGRRKTTERSRRKAG